MGQAGTRHLGWKLDPKGLYLIPDAVFEVTTEMGIDLSLTVPESKESLHAKLRQSSYLLANNWNKRRKSTAIRRVIEGEERTVLRLLPKFLTE
jgi:pyridoxine 5'-phosphate synthase PdxJ